MSEHISKRKRFCKTAFRIQRAIRVIRTQAFFHNAYKSFDNCMIRDNVLSALRLMVYIPSSNTVNKIAIKRCKRYAKTFTIEFTVDDKFAYVLSRELIEILKYLDCYISYDPKYAKTGIYKLSVYNSDKVCIKTCGHTVPKIEIANGAIANNEYEKMFNEILASKIVHSEIATKPNIVNRTTVTKVVTNGTTVTKPVSNKTTVTKPIKLLAVETNFVTMKSEIDTLDIELNKLNAIISEHEKQLKLAKAKLRTITTKRNKLKTEMIDLVKSI